MKKRRNEKKKLAEPDRQLDGCWDPSEPPVVIQTVVGGGSEKKRNEPLVNWGQKGKKETQNKTETVRVQDNNPCCAGEKNKINKQPFESCLKLTPVQDY